MKRLASLFLAGSLAFAGNIYSQNNEEAKQIDIPFNFKRSTQNNIQNVAISNDNKKVLVTTKYKVKIFDTKDGELIKVLNFNDIIKSTFSQDNKQIFILTKNKFYTYNTTNYKEIGHINSSKNFKDFFIRKEFLGLIKNEYNSNISILNLKTNHKINSFKSNGYIYHGAFSPNLKKIALTNDSYKSFIYDLNGELLNSLPSNGYYGIKWLNNNNIVTYSSNHTYIINIKTGKTIATIKGDSQIDEVAVLNGDNILIFNDNKMKIYNVSKRKFLNKIFIIEGKNSRDDVESVALSDDKKFLAIAYLSKNMKLYKTSKIFKDFITTTNNNSNNNISQVTKQEEKKVTEQAPKVIIKKEIVEKVVVKTVKVKDTVNKKPTLSIYASQTDGEVPLTVNFKFLANDEDGKIASYYINFAGKEIMHKGNPTKSFNYTFKNPGKYKIMVAVKDNNGAITTKQVVINAKPKHEETFEEYKKSLIGR